jgi:hypothetical protein
VSARYLSFGPSDDSLARSAAALGCGYKLTPSICQSMLGASTHEAIPAVDVPLHDGIGACFGSAHSAADDYARCADRSKVSTIPSSSGFMHARTAPSLHRVGAAVRSDATKELQRHWSHEVSEYDSNDVATNERRHDVVERRGNQHVSVCPVARGSWVRPSRMAHCLSDWLMNRQWHSYIGAITTIFEQLNRLRKAALMRCHELQTK